MIKFGVPFGDVFYNNTPSATPAPWDLQNVSFAFKNDDETKDFFIAQEQVPTDRDMAFLRTTSTCRVSVKYQNPSRLLAANCLDDLRPTSVQTQWAFNKLVGDSLYIGGSATSNMLSILQTLRQGKGIQATVAKRIWRMVLGNPTFLVAGATLDATTRKPKLFASWGAPYPWYHKPGFKVPRALADSIARKQGKMIKDAKESFRAQDPDLPDLTDEVMSMYESVLDEMEEPIRNLEAYHEGPDGPWSSFGETSVHGSYDTADGAWAASGSYNYDGVNKFVLRAESNGFGGVDYTGGYERVPRKFFKTNWSLQCQHNSRTRGTKVGLWAPLAGSLSARLTYDVGSKRAGVELFTHSDGSAAQKSVTFDAPVFEAGEVPGKVSRGGAGVMELKWEAF